MTEDVREVKVWLFDFVAGTAKPLDILIKANVREKVLFSQTDFLPWEILLIKKLDFEETKPT